MRFVTYPKIISRALGPLFTKRHRLTGIDFPVVYIRLSDHRPFHVYNGNPCNKRTVSSQWGDALNRNDFGHNWEGQFIAILCRNSQCLISQVQKLPQPNYSVTFINADMRHPTSSVCWLVHPNYVSQLMITCEYHHQSSIDYIHNYFTQDKYSFQCSPFSKINKQLK